VASSYFLLILGWVVNGIAVPVQRLRPGARRRRRCEASV